MNIRDFENNKYYKHIRSIGQRAVVYNNKIDKEIDLFSDLTNTEKKMIKKIFIKLIKELDNVKQKYKYYLYNSFSKSFFCIVFLRSIYQR